MFDEKASFKKIHKNFCKFIDSHSQYSFYTSSTSLQRKSVSDCESYLLVIKKYKYQAIDRENEYEANNIFHIQCVINALRSYLLTWIQLKENDYQKSWSNLIDAQDYLSIALKVNDYEGIRSFESRIKNTENSIFPNSISYLSSGITETIGKCSICKKSFTICEHIENHIYMGRLCQRIDKHILDINHVALVKNPRDRRCIIINTSDDEGNEINTFTLENTGVKFDQKNGLHCKGIVFCFPKLDLH